jgi:hypothetical protein
LRFAAKIQALLIIRRELLRSSYKSTRAAQDFFPAPDRFHGFVNHLFQAPFVLVVIRHDFSREYSLGALPASRVAGAIADFTLRRRPPSRRII